MTEPEDNLEGPPAREQEGSRLPALPDQEPLPPLPDRHARFGIPAFSPVLAVSMAMVVVFAIARGSQAAISAGAGAATALGDLWILTRMVHAMTNIAPEQQGARWAPLVLVKFLLLFSGVVVLLSRNIFQPLPFLTGLGALPLGIVVGTFLPRGSR